MATLAGITMIKRFTYRGDATEEFANTYHFTGAIPADAAAWKALADALFVVERPILPATASFIRAYGYDSDASNATSVWTRDYLAAGDSVAGSLSTGGVQPLPGDAAIFAWWKTDRNNSRGKPIYLRKYFHDVIPGGTADTYLTAQRTALTALATKLRDGSFLDARTLRSRTHADAILTSGSGPFVTTRTLKRRGKRP